MTFERSILTDFAVLGVVALLCAWAVFFDGYPIGDDYKNQIIAFEAFREQFNGGDIYPRWLHDINHGFGAANLYFYPPLIYYAEYATGLLLPADAETPTILIFSSFFFLALSGISAYFWLSSLCSRRGAVIGAALYMAAPYHLFFDLYERNNGAEFAVYAWIPLLFLFAQENGGNRAFRAAKLSLAYALFVLTHLPSAVFVTPFAGLWALLFIFLRHEGKSPVERLRPVILEGVFFTGCVALGCLLAGLYLYPALTMLGMVRSHVLWSGPFYDYNNWFVWGGARCPAIYNAFCVQMSVVATVTVFAPLISGFPALGRMEKREKGFFGGLTILIGACFVLMIPASQILWSVFSPLQKIQFPFRLMILADLFFAALTALMFSVRAGKGQRSGLYAGRITLILAFAAVSFFTARFVQNSWHPDQDFFDYRIKHRILTGEFFPNNPEMTVTIPDFVEKTPEIPLLRTEPPSLRAEAVRKLPRRYEIEVEAEEPGTLFVRQFFFPGWRARIEKDGLPPEDADIRAVEPYGQIKVALPAGTYRVVLDLPSLRQEQIGGMMSAGAPVLFLLLLLAGMTQRRKG
ncbi:MAG: hypothetical protein KDI90_02475 [Alphaproteobacteria bacterium]|nr:hypothetical protein [Alphaproteobacteria bacterium]MCB9974509.1 hypothetical protein [Rhodospirillales bacterium]